MAKPTYMVQKCFRCQNRMPISVLRVTSNNIINTSYYYASALYSYRKKKNNQKPKAFYVNKQHFKYNQMNIAYYHLSHTGGFTFFFFFFAVFLDTFLCKTILHYGTIVQEMSSHAQWKCMHTKCKMLDCTRNKIRIIRMSVGPLNKQNMSMKTMDIFTKNIKVIRNV